jgi:hypothetical protein
MGEIFGNVMKFVTLGLHTAESEKAKMQTGKKTFAFSRPMGTSILLLLVLLCWALSSSIGSGGDTDNHLSSIWCAWGEKANVCEDLSETATGYSATVPFMFQMCDGRPIDFSPACEFTKDHAPTQTLRTSAPAFQNLYYKFMRIFVTENVQASVLIMRIFNSLLVTFLLFGVLRFCSGRNRIGLIIGFLTTLISVSISTITSINPRSWATIGVIFSWTFLYELMSNKNSKFVRNSLLAFYIICCSLAFSSRIDASTFLVFSNCLIILLVFINRGFSPRKILFTGLKFFVPISFAVLLIPRLNSVISYQSSPSYGRLQFFTMQLVHIPESLAQIWAYDVGQQGNGPGLIGLIGFGVFVLFIGQGLQEINRRQGWLMSLTAAFIFITMYRGSLLVDSLVPLGGRYVLSLAAFFMGIVYVASEGSLAFLAKNGFRTSVVVALSSAHALALYSNIEFFTKRGQNIGFYDALSLRGDWWWNSWSSPNWVFIFGVISFIFFIKSALDFLSNSITVEL